MNHDDLREKARAATGGPWEVLTKEYPHYLGGKHVERIIATTYIHPQLKGPIPVVSGSVGIPERKGDPGRPLVWLQPEDAAWIAAANPTRILALLDELDALRKDAERLDWIANEYITVASFARPTGGDDADVGWQFLQHHCGEQKPRPIWHHYRDDLRAAIDAARAADDMTEKE